MYRSGAFKLPGKKILTQFTSPKNNNKIHVCERTTCESMHIDPDPFDSWCVYTRTLGVGDTATSHSEKDFADRTKAITRIHGSQSGVPRVRLQRLLLALEKEENPGVTVCAGSPRIHEAKSGKLQTQGQPELHSKILLRSRVGWTWWHMA